MKDVHIEARISSPEVRFDAAQQILSLTGESYPENAAECYHPVFKLLEDALQQMEQPFILNLELAYINSSSSKVLLDIFDMLDAAAGEGKAVTVNWYYDPENETALETGEEFQEDIEHLSFNVLEKQP